jgi:hypothetical protein
MNLLGDDYKIIWDTDDFHKTRLYPERRTKHRRKPLVKAVGDVWYLHFDKKGIEWHCGKDKYIPKMKIEVIAMDDSNVTEVTPFRIYPPRGQGWVLDESSEPKRWIRTRPL